MRLTTKIVFGIILSIFFVSLAFIIGFSFSDRKNYTYRSNINTIELSQDNMTGIELDSFNTILIDEIPYESEKRGISWNGHVNFDSIPGKGKPDMLFISEHLKDFVVINTSNDTLRIKLNMHELGRKYESKDHDPSRILGINIYFQTAKIDVINKLEGFSVNIKNIETDSIKIISHGSISINSCKAQFIDPLLKNVRKELNMENCNVKRINLDCDHTKNWNIENNNIEEQHITGSDNHNITLHRKESGKIKWIPKNDKAELNIKIPGDTTEIIIQ